MSSVLDHHNVIWLGDLNFRLTCSDDEARRCAGGGWEVGWNGMGWVKDCWVVAWTVSKSLGMQTVRACVRSTSSAGWMTVCCLVWLVPYADCCVMQHLARHPAGHATAHALDQTVGTCSGLMDLRYLRTGRLDALLSYDELSQEMQAKRVFQVRTEVVAMEGWVTA